MKGDAKVYPFKKPDDGILEDAEVAARVARGELRKFVPGSVRVTPKRLAELRRQVRAWPPKRPKPQPVGSPQPTG